MLNFILICIIFFILFAVTWRILIKPKSRKSFPLHATGTAGMSKPPAFADRLVRRIVSTTSKRTGKYVPGSLGLSAVSRAIIKDYGSILSRATRKYYAKQYKLPRFVYI